MTRKTKLAEIKRAIKKNRKVVLVREEYNHFGTRAIVELFVAPVEGVYTANALQEILQSLVPPGMAPDFEVQFSAQDPRFMILGKRRFCEDIGKRVTERHAQIRQADMAKMHGFRAMDTKMTRHEQPVIRQIHIRLLPNRAMAAVAGGIVGSQFAEIANWADINQYRSMATHP